MERVALLIEETGERLRCLLNPSSLVVKRQAGLRPRRSSGGPLSGAALTDDPLLYTGGGRTEMQLDLLFDVSIAGSSIQSSDVRDLTGPIWALAENRPGIDADDYGTVPHVRFIWGKAWNVRTVVVAVAERLEQFEPSGVPGRSWMRLRLRRVAEEIPPAEPPPQPLEELILPTGDEPIPEEDIVMHPLVITPGEEESGSPGEVSNERLEQLADRYFGDPSLWRLIAAFNKIMDPLRMAGEFLKIPPRSILEKKE